MSGLEEHSDNPFFCVPRIFLMSMENFKLSDVQLKHWAFTGASFRGMGNDTYYFSLWAQLKSKCGLSSKVLI